VPALLLGPEPLRSGHIHGDGHRLGLRFGLPGTFDASAGGISSVPGIGTRGTTRLVLDPCPDIANGAADITGMLPPNRPAYFGDGPREARCRSGSVPSVTTMG